MKERLRLSDGRSFLSSGGAVFARLRRIFSLPIPQLSNGPDVERKESQCPHSLQMHLAGNLLAHFGKDGKPDVAIPKISQETLAEMVGTTRSRVSFFMNRFRKLGFIDYNSESALQVHSSLLNIVLHD